LEATVAAIQRRWGTKALGRGERSLRPPVDIPHISTSFPDLDKALVGIGGIPRGRLTEILGAPTSGMATLALKIVASAQPEGDTAVYVDLGRTFDPDYAARCGVNLAQLLLVRPADGLEALEIVQSLVASRGAGVLVFDAATHLMAGTHGAQSFSTALRQLPAALARSSAALMFLTPLQFGGAMSTANYPSGFALPHYATIRLQLKKEKWIQKGRDIRGYQARVLVLKNKMGRAGRQATIAITFNGVVKGDST
jgi:recombination protein RecA